MRIVYTIPFSRPIPIIPLKDIPDLEPLALSEEASEQRTRQRATLLAKAKAQHERWLHLYRECDVWTNLEKRTRMFQARWEYQEAMLAYCALATAK